jgi:hypothetical protein
MLFDLADSRADGISITMPVIIRNPVTVLMVNTDWVPMEEIWFLDNPAVFCASGLKLIEIV